MSSKFCLFLKRETQREPQRYTANRIRREIIIQQKVLI